MKDAAPRIFRSLERQFGQGEFDTVVAAAVATFGSLRNPTAAQVEDLSRLVVPLWQRVGAETKRNVAASLSHARRVPRSLVELLVESPVDVAAPFLVSSPVLTEADLARLLGSGDERVVRLVRNRHERGFQPPPAGADAPSPAPAATAAPARPEVEAPSLAADFLAETPFNARPPAPGRRAPPRTAEEARDLLRRLATAGRGRLKRAQPGFSDLMNAALAREDAEFYALLTEIFTLDADTLERMISEESGERLAIALRALRASPGDALSVLMLMKPAIGLDVARFDSTARFYKALRPEDCRAMVEAMRFAPRHVPVSSEEAFRTRDPARPSFGRRLQRPDAREAKG